jgi:GxxExxY protein
MEINRLTEKIIGAAITVHRELGPGLLESTYEACLLQVLVREGLTVERQKELPVVFQGERIDCGYRIDLLVEGRVVVELKAKERLHRVHYTQLLTYLKLSGCKVGLLLNFNVKLLREGIHRVVLDLPEPTRRPPRALR